MAINSKDNYWADSITSLWPRDAVRKRTWMYIWNANTQGMHHLAQEIISNSIDEVINWYWDTIIIRLIDKDTIEIEDFWRWIPFWINSKTKKEVLYQNLTELHSWGKLDNTSWKSAYKNSWGMNGVWLAVTNFLSTEMTVTSIRAEETATIHFVNWESKEKTKIVKKKSNRTWTIVRFKPDYSVFKNVKWFSSDYILSKVKDQIYLEKLTIIFEDWINDKTYTFKNEEGISKYLSDYNKQVEEDKKANELWEDWKSQTFHTPITSIIKWENIVWVSVKSDEADINIDFAFQFVSWNKKQLKWYTNSIYNPEWWRHILWLTNWIFKWIKNVLKYQGQKWENILKEIVPEDVLSNVVGLISVKMPEPDLEGQTKIKLNTTYVTPIIEAEVSKTIERTINQKDIEIIMSSIESRINFRKNIKKAESMLWNNITLSEKELQSKLPTKLTDATTKNRLEAELFIVEWDSAGWGLKKERNPQIHWIMPLRWKVLNVLDSSDEKIQGNQEINNLIYAISWWKLWDNFVINKDLRYWKIIILWDADPDGKHIANLVIWFFVKYYPMLIEKWHLYIGNPPLFSATKKDSVLYFFSDKEKEDFLNTKEGKSWYKISRFKWLWEMDEDELAKSALNPRYRKLHKVTMEDAEEAKDYIAKIMSDPNERAEFVKDYKDIYIDKVENDLLWLSNKTKDIVNIVKDNAIEYAIEVNEERAIPAIEDWLKNVNRRTIYSLVNSLNSKSNWEFIKSATIVWHVIWYFHPHWDMAVYEAMVYLIQDFRQNHQLVQGHGSYGSIFAPNAYWANRYTKARISEFAEDTLVDNLAKKPVPFIPNFTNTLEEPLVLPAKIPLALIFWDQWTWYGMSHKTLPHNIKEVIDATIWYLSKKKWEVYEATDYIKWPDLPQGWYLLNTTQEIKDIYNNPKWGKFTFRTNIEPYIYNKKDWFIITNVPSESYNVEDLLSKLKDLFYENQFYWIKQIIDISGEEKNDDSKELKKKKWIKDKKKWLKIFLEIKTDKDIKREFIIENLYSKVKYNNTWLEYVVKYNPLYVNKDRELKFYTLNEIISSFVNFRRETVSNILNYDIGKLEKEISTLNNKILFALNVEKIVKIIKAHNTRNQIKVEIIKAFPKNNLTDEDAEIIIETKLINIKDLTVLEKSLKEKEKELAKLKDIVSNPKKLDKLIIEELLKIKEKYNSAHRKTKFLLQKDLKIINEMKDLYKEEQKKLKELEKFKPNYIFIDELGFLYRDFAANETTVQTRLDKIVEKVWDNPYLLKNINSNEGTLYVLTKENWYYIHLQKLPLKQDRVAVNRIIKGFKWEAIIWFISSKEEVEKFNETLYVIYEDTKWNIWGFSIDSKDLAKSRQWFALFNNWNKVINIIRLENWENVIDLSKEKLISIGNYKKLKSYEIDIKNFPNKKSFSSWKILLKK